MLRAKTTPSRKSEASKDYSIFEARLSVAASTEVFHGIKAKTRNIAEPTDAFPLYSAPWA